tara:strand:+ start:1940 stop:2140 length:201 start_codon:yes stop_codon:yes gene_type:complete
MTDGTFVKDLDIMDAFSRDSDSRCEKNLAYLQQWRLEPRGFYFGEYSAKNVSISRAYAHKELCRTS